MRARAFVARRGQRPHSGVPCEEDLVHNSRKLRGDRMTLLFFQLRPDFLKVLPEALDLHNLALNILLEGDNPLQGLIQVIVVGEDDPLDRDADRNPKNVGSGEDGG